MQASTFTASPLPYSKACDTFGPRIWTGATIQAALVSKTLVHFLQPRAMLNSLVRQLISKGRPTCIPNRLGQVGLGKSSSRYITHRNQIKFMHDAGAEFVQKITVPVCRLRLDGFDAPLLVGTLGDSQPSLCISVQPSGLDFLACAQGCKVFESQVNAHTVVDGALHNVSHLNSDVKKPIASAVLLEVGAVFDDCANGNLAAFEVTAFAWHST
jgi:hypothetical protein